MVGLAGVRDVVLVPSASEASRREPHAMCQPGRAGHQRSARAVLWSTRGARQSVDTRTALLADDVAAGRHGRVAVAGTAPVWALLLAALAALAARVNGRRAQTLRTGQLPRARRSRAGERT